MFYLKQTSISYSQRSDRSYLSMEFKQKKIGELFSFLAFRASIFKYSTVKNVTIPGIYPKIIVYVHVPDISISVFG